MYKKFVFTALIASALACQPRQAQIISATSSKIAIDASTQPLADTAYLNYLAPFKQQVDAKMNVVIGTAAQNMRGHAPESLLSNLSADIYRKAATDHLKTEVDIAIVNLGGLRTIIPAGNITMRKVFELMPFENELVILYLKGDKLNELCQYFASIGGEGISGLRMIIDNKKAIDITINGAPLDLNKTYSLATNDYLAGGNDKMEALTAHQKRINTGLKVRTMLLNYIQSETAQGRIIDAQLDGRITIKK